MHSEETHRTQNFLAQFTTRGREMGRRKGIGVATGGQGVRCNCRLPEGPKMEFGLTRLLHLALLSRFTRMSQLHPGEINFERQPGQIRAVCDSEQDFRNAGGCILQ